MTGFFRGIADCNRFVAASDTVKPTTYLARIGAGWLAAVPFTVFFNVHRDFIVEEEIMFQVLLLLLLVSSRIGRFPVNRGTLLIVLTVWLMIGGAAFLGSHGLMALKIETPIPVWRAYSYAFLVGMTWMSAFFLWMTFALCQRHITGKNNYRDINCSFHGMLKKKGMVPRNSTKYAAAVLSAIIGLGFPYYLSYYGAHEWTVRMLGMSLIGGLTGLAGFVLLFQCRNYLKSAGKLA